MNGVCRTKAYEKRRKKKGREREKGHYNIITTEEIEHWKDRELKIESRERRAERREREKQKQVHVIIQIKT